MIQYNCPRCGLLLRIEDSQAGLPTKCCQCGAFATAPSMPKPIHPIDPKVLRGCLACVGCLVVLIATGIIAYKMAMRNPAGYQYPPGTSPAEVASAKESEHSLIDPAQIISTETYDKLELGMGYSEVAYIIGRYGDLVLNRTVGDVEQKGYSWCWVDKDRIGQVTCVFANDRLAAKEYK